MKFIWSDPKELDITDLILCIKACIWINVLSFSEQIMRSLVQAIENKFGEFFSCHWRIQNSSDLEV